MFGLGPLELGMVLFVAVLLFGVKRLPELGSGLGSGIANFKKGLKEANAIDVTPPSDKKTEPEKKEEPPTS